MIEAIFISEDFPNRKWVKPKTFEYKGNGRWVYNWFSNFEPSTIIVDYKEYKSVENFYQAHKAVTLQDFEMVRKASISASKQLGKKIRIRETWEQEKFEVMFIGLRAKFTQDAMFRKRLLETKGDIVEWNNWNDTIWGASIKTGYGQNALGCMLMMLRDSVI